MAFRRGRHCRPSKISRTVAVASTAIVPAGIIAVSATGASAAEGPQVQEPPEHAQVFHSLAVRHAAIPGTVTVAPGNSLSGISLEHCGTTADWPGIYDANRGKIANPDLIYPGQVLTLNCTAGHITTARVQVSPPRRTEDMTYGHPNYCGDGDGDGYDISCSSLHHSDPPPRYHAVTVSSGNTGNYGSVNPGSYSGYQRCVITRESAGNSHAVNPSSGAGGLYQFLPSTWAGLGYPGLPENAPVWEQDQAFQKLYSEAGSSPWVSDGC